MENQAQVAFIENRLDRFVMTRFLDFFFFNFRGEFSK